MNTLSWTNLCQAILNSKYSEIYKMYLEKGGADFRDEKGDSILHIAVDNSHLEIVDFLSQEGTLINALNRERNTPLALAAKNGNTDIVNVLLHYGADVDGNRTFTPLHQAVETGHLEVIKLLLKSGAKTDIIALNSITALHLACLKGNLEIVRTLLTSGCNVNCENNSNETPLITSARHEKEEVVELLIEFGADIEHRDSYQKTALLHAVLMHNLKMVQVLLKCGADIHFRTKSRYTLLHYAAILTGARDMIELLLEKGIDINVVNCANETPLMLVIKYYLEPLDTVKYLIENNADVNIANHKGWTPIMYAINRKQVEMIQLFLKLINDINFQNGKGNTALHLICARSYWCEKNWEIIKLLLNHGADINIKNCDNLVPFDYTVVYISNFFKNYILMLKTAGQYLCKENLKLIENTWKESISHKSDCEKEILKMKQQKVPNSEQTLFFLITCDSDKIIRHVQSKDVLNFFDDCKNDYPVYYNLLSHKLRTAFERYKLFKASYDFLHSLDFFPVLPYFILEKILNYLPNKDLKTLLGGQCLYDIVDK